MKKWLITVSCVLVVVVVLSVIFLTNRNAQIDTLNKDLNALQLEYNSLKKKSDETISGLNEQVDSLNRQVEDLNLQVEGGQLYGFIGPNGAGKSTAIKLMCGILKPDEGMVQIAGHDVATDRIAAQQQIGYVPDNNDLYDRLTGMEYLNFMGDIYGVSAADRKAHIEKYLNIFSLEDAAASQIRTYSKGMKQKIMVIGALIHNPPVWILDEPLGGLDPRAAHLLKEEMRAHCQKGNTVFFSTHVLEVAEKLCTRIGIIQKGTLRAEGTLEELRSGEKGASLEELFLELTDDGGESDA